MVEMAVIETASESSSTQLSTSVVVHLRFPSKTVEQQTVFYGSLLVMIRRKAKPYSRLLLIDAQSKAAVLLGRTAA